MSAPEAEPLRGPCPSPRPWSVKEQPDRLVIEDANGRQILSFALYGDEALDAETRANFDLMVERANTATD